MSRLFKRGLKVTTYRPPTGFVSDHPDYFESNVTALEIVDLRVQFAVEKSTDSEPNKCDLVITNAAATTRAELTRAPLVVRIDAGYDGELRHVFTGDLRHGYSLIEAPDWNTYLQLGDGDRAYRYARVNRSYKKGTSVLVALRDAAESMGLSLPKNVEASQELQRQFATGISLVGPARAELTQLLAPFGYTWGVHNGQMQILKDDEVAAGQALLVAQKTGLLGVPTLGTPDKKGSQPTLTARMLLYPQLNPGVQITVQSRGIDGTFKVERVTHTGDTHGEDWLTEIEARPL